MRLKPLVFFFLVFLTIAPSAYAEPMPDTSADSTMNNKAWQEGIVVNEQTADRFQQTALKDYYKAYIPVAESVGNSYAECMKLCTDLSGSCASDCRGQYMRTTTQERVVDTAPAGSYAAATTQDCYRWKDGAIPDPKLQLETKACDGFSKQEYADPKRPVVHDGMDDFARSRTSIHSGDEQPLVPEGTNTKARDDARNSLRRAIALDNKLGQ